MFMTFAKRQITAFLLMVSLLVSACGDSFDDRIAANPLANPTLSFAEPVHQVSSPGSGASLVSAGNGEQHVTMFELDAGLAEQAFEELRLQAEGAGYELDLRTSPERLPAGSWTGTAPGLHILTILVLESADETTVQVTLW